MIIFLFTQCFSQPFTDLIPKNHIQNSNKIEKTKDLYYSKEGFYKVTLQDKDTINVKFFNKTLRLYLFIPDHQRFAISEIIIDGKSINFEDYKGLSIEGTDNATLKFAVSSHEIPAEFWLIRPSICPNPAVYLYGNQKMEFGTSFGNNLCIFSPSFDSTNNEFKIRFGITKGFKHRTSNLYTNKFDSPDQTNNESEVRSYNIDSSFFVQFHGDYHSTKISFSYFIKSILATSKFFYSKKLISINKKRSYLGAFFYERITKVKKHENTSCNVHFLYRCRSNGCCPDYISEFNWGCSDSKNFNIFMILTITLSVAVLLIIVSWFTILCVKKKKMEKESYLSSMLSDQNDSLKKMPTNTYT